jgi:hypothetical protein
MPCGDAQQGDRGSFRTPASLLPVAERMNADAHGAGELDLGETDEAPHGGDVLAGLELSEQEALPDARGNGPGKLLVGQLWNFTHGFCPMWES